MAKPPVKGAPGRMACCSMLAGSLSFHVLQCIACRCPCTHAALCLQRATQVATKGALGWLGLAEG